MGACQSRGDSLSLRPGLAGGEWHPSAQKRGSHLRGASPPRPVWGLAAAQGRAGLGAPSRARKRGRGAEVPTKGRFPCGAAHVSAAALPFVWGQGRVFITAGTGTMAPGATGTGRDSRGRGRCVPGPAPGGGWASSGLQDTSWDKQALTATPAGGRGPGTKEGSSSLCQLRGASQSHEEGAARGARAGSGQCSGSVCGHSPSRTRPCPGRRGQATRAAGTDL